MGVPVYVPWVGYFKKKTIIALAFQFLALQIA
jgi:hypothetical protein